MKVPSSGRRQARRMRFELFTAVLAVCAFRPPVASAQGVSGVPTPPATVASPATDASAYRAALVQRIESAAATGGPTGVQTIVHIAAAGPPPDVLATALDALGALARPEGAPTIARALRHRRSVIRRHAIAAARAVHTAGLVDDLADLLGDPDAAVRTDAAQALAEVGTQAIGARAIEAFQRDLEDATGPDGGPLTAPCAIAVGRFGSGADVQRLVAFVGRAPFAPMIEALRPAVRRTNLPEPVRIAVVQAVGRARSRDARAFLTALINESNGQDTPLIRAAREQITRIPE